MSDQKPANPPAFPYINATNNGGSVIDNIGSSGMTLRDYFAGQALIGVVIGAANSGLSAGERDIRTGKSLAEQSAEFCLAHADAMLKAREGK